MGDKIVAKATLSKAGVPTVPGFTLEGDAAEPGDTISLQPGTYVEAVVIDKDLTLAGDGPREEIIINADGTITFPDSNGNGIPDYLDPTTS